MKKILLMCLYVSLFSNLGKAQIHTGIGGKVAIPTEIGYPIDYAGIGLNISGGYLFKEKLDINVSGENIWFHSYLKGFKISSLQANVRYMIIKKPFKPYIGFGVGFFEVSYVFWPGEPKSRQSDIGYIPSIGALFNLGWVKGLFINPEFSYYYVHTIYNKINPINFNIGLVYFLGSKKSAEESKTAVQ